MSSHLLHRPPPMNHVFVDFENVNQIDPSLIGSKSVSIVLLLGARQTKLDAALVEKLMEHAASIQLVRLTSSGRNALDFALAYYVGRAAVADPAGHFHIVSKDTGFDTLIDHLRSKHIQVQRHGVFPVLDGATSIGPAAPVAQAIPAKAKPSPPSKVQSTAKVDPAAHALDQLRKYPNTRPKRKTRLASHLLALLGKKATGTDVLALIKAFQDAGHLNIDEKGAVTYQLDV